MKNFIKHFLTNKKTAYVVALYTLLFLGFSAHTLLAVEYIERSNPFETIIGNPGPDTGDDDDGGDDGGIGNPPNPEGQIPGLTMTYSGDATAANGQKANYKLQVSYTGSEDIRLSVAVPVNSTLVNPSANYGYDNDTRTATWSLNSIAPAVSQPSQPANPPTSQFPLAKFQGYGFPAPTTPRPMNAASLNGWNTLKSHAQKAAQLTGVDVGIIGMWAWIELDGNNMNNYIDNCNDAAGDPNPNSECTVWSNWQVGYGVRPNEHIDRLKEAFNAMHPGGNVRAVGQKVIDDSGSKSYTRIQLTNPTTFPDISLDTIVNGAKGGNQNMRHLSGLLMKDPGISAYLVAKAFQGRVGPNLANTMEGWSSSYYNRQKVVNLIAGIYAAGASGSGDSGAIQRGATLTFQLQPSQNDISMSSKFVAAAIGNATLKQETPIVTTRVGEGGPVLPPGGGPGTGPAGKFSCPVPNGTITCGTFANPRRGCGHCGIGYDKDLVQCKADYKNGTFNGMDLTNGQGGLQNRNQPISLPSLGSGEIEWKFFKKEQGIPGEARQQYVGYDKISTKSYFLQLHHTRPEARTPGTTYQPGAIGAYICAAPTAGSDCDHVHIQILIGSGLDHSKWIDAVQNFACN